MNFDSFLPGDLKDALNRELEILHQTAMQGTMDTLKDTNEDEEWEMAAGTGGGDSDDSDHDDDKSRDSNTSSRSSWSDKSDKMGSTGVSSISDKSSASSGGVSKSSNGPSEVQKQTVASKPLPRKLPPFMAGITTKKEVVSNDKDATLQDKNILKQQNESEVKSSQVGSKGLSSSPPMSAAAAALLAVEQSHSPNQLNGKDEDAFSFSEARNQVLSRLTHETESMTSSEFRPSLTGTSNHSQSHFNDDTGYNNAMSSPVPTSHQYNNQGYRREDGNYHHSYQQQQHQQHQRDTSLQSLNSPPQVRNENISDSSYDSIDRALFSPNQSLDSINLSSPYSPSMMASPQPPHNQQGNRSYNNSSSVKNPYSMHSQVEAFIQGRDEVLPRTSLVEKAANKHASYHPGQASDTYGNRQNREPNPFLRGIDPLSNPQFLPSPIFPPNSSSSSLLPPFRHNDNNSSRNHQYYEEGFNSGNDYDDMNDPILASIHNRNYLSDQIKQHEQRSQLQNNPASASSNSYLSNMDHAFDRNNNLGVSGGGRHHGIFDDSLSNDDTSSWLSEQSYMRSVNASTHDPFKQLLVNSGMVNSNSGWFDPNNSRYAQWLALWEEWKYTAYIFAPGIALMGLYFKFSYAEEIN